MSLMSSLNWQFGLAFPGQMINEEEVPGHIHSGESSIMQMRNRRRFAVSPVTSRNDQGEERKDNAFYRLRLKTNERVNVKDGRCHEEKVNQAHPYHRSLHRHSKKKKWRRSSSLTMKQMIQRKTPSNPSNCREKSTATVNYVQTYFYTSQIGVCLCLSIVQIRFALIYDDLCPIDQRVNFFLFVSALGEQCYALLAIFVLVFSFLTDVSPYVARLFLPLFVGDQILLIVLFLWFLVGNYLVFHLLNQVQSINPYLSRTYCHPRLYQCALWTLIVDYVLLLFYAVGFLLSTWKSKKNSSEDNIASDPNERAGTP